MRCRSWTPISTHTHVPSFHAHGHFRPCRNKAEKPFPRCYECYERLAFHPDPDVRKALAQEPYLPSSIADLLTSDPEVAVRTSAAQAKAIPDGHRKQEVVVSAWESESPGSALRSEDDSSDYVLRNESHSSIVPDSPSAPPPHEQRDTSTPQPPSPWG